MSRTALRICPLCEATCGLVLTVEDHPDKRVTAARGDRDDVFSAGFICPKGASFPELDNDPDRLRAPLVRKNGELVETGWDEALKAAVAGLRAAAEAKSGIAVYLGNPNAHTVAGALYAPQLIRALGTRQVYSASTLDQMPKQVACGYLYGNPFAFTVPDIDRTEHLVIIGANPLVSNGSVATAADFGGKLKALKRRGGRLTVIDPNRTRTAELADRHLAPRPGTDAALLFAVVHTLFDEDLVDPTLGGLADHVSGVERLRAEAADFPPEAVTALCGLDADVIRQLARDIAAAPTAAVYGRIGTCTVRFGTLTSWLVDVINVLTGNL
ncbi:MAG: molybdopterin-binding oxidoreductase, partial [Mycobacteriaceae bacterium]|nr:molybdopterin-binding oxidoreductase [Mycobacteriaceae bacterium]